MRLTLSLLALALVTAPAMAQQHADHDKPVQGGGNRPAGYLARTDNGGPLTNLKFEAMAPGHHITTGPAVIV